MEAGVDERLPPALGDHQADAVALDAAQLGRLGRLQTGRQVECEGAHETTSPEPVAGTSSRAQ